MNTSFFARNKKPLAIGAAVAIGIAVAIAAFTSGGDAGKAEEKKPGSKPSLTVTTTTPQQAMLPVTLAANGNLAAWQEAVIGTETSGLRIAEVRVNVGDRVRRGQVLATFGGDTLRAEVAQARASVAEAEANAAEAASNASRARSLQATGALSASQINQYVTAEKTAQARVQAAQAMFNAQQVRLAQTALLSPDDGIISARTATVGAVVAPGTELFRLIRKGRLEWRAEVTANELGRITVGTTAIVAAASGARMSGRVRTIAPSLDPQTRNAIVYVDVNPLPGPAAGSARAGMYARGEFELGAVPTLTVPQAAVVVREGFHYVFRVNPDNRVTQVKVQIGRIAGDRLEVASGLPADARIVAAGAGFLNDGDLVRVMDAAAAAGAGPARTAASNPVRPASAATSAPRPPASAASAAVPAASR